jgi:hypothetical protein
MLPSKDRILAKKFVPVNPLKDYKGPQTHHAILRKIHEEAIEQGMDISFNYIRTTVFLFFSVNGFPYHFKKYVKFAVRGIGRWVPNAEGRHRLKLGPPVGKGNYKHKKWPAEKKKKKKRKRPRRMGVYMVKSRLLQLEQMNKEK